MTRITTITDPRRMLAGWSFALQPVHSCYVLGCYRAETENCRHRVFGAVWTCREHDPRRYGCGDDLTQPAGGIVSGNGQAGSPAMRLTPVPTIDGGDAHADDPDRLQDGRRRPRAKDFMDALREAVERGRDETGKVQTDKIDLGF